MCESVSVPLRLPSARPGLAPLPYRRLGLRYADGVLMGEGGSTLAPDDPEPERILEVPYRSTDVKGRVGPYDVLQPLGRGSMGVVYRAWSPRLRRLCALKVLTGGEHSSELDVLRFQNEAMLAARLDHPNIVRIFDAGEDKGQSYFVMEFIDGRPFTTFLGDRDPAVLRRGVEVLARVAGALDYAHGLGIVHRDVKPDNILVDADDEPHVTDFGLAKGMGEDAGLTFAGRPMGTPWYMPPEQANGELQGIGPLSDVYSLGATLYHLLSGQPPFADDNPLVVLVDVVRKAPERPSEAARRNLGRDVPPDLEAVCLKAMEKSADRRYASARALADDLEAWLAGRPVSVGRSTGLQRLRRRIEHNRPVLIWAAGLLSTLVLLTTAFAAVVLLNLHRTNESLRDFGRHAGLDQSETVERAIQAAMMQEKPEVARSLVDRVRRSPGLMNLEVVSPDGTVAWDDIPTKDHGPPLTDDAPLPRGSPLARLGISPAQFASLLRERRVVVHERVQEGEALLTVMRPIVNQAVCQPCHQDAAEGDVLAVLVTRQSLTAVSMQVRENRRATLVVGGATSVALVVLLYVLSRLMGVQFRRSFAPHRPRPPAGDAGATVEDRP
jgi:serine/threonine protein kinase